MNIEATKLELMQLLLQTKKESILTRIKNIFEEDDSIKNERISVDQYNLEIDESIADIEAGNFQTHDEVRKIMRQWAKR